MKTAILILAAGSSSRMGEPKQLLPFKQTTLLGSIIQQAKKSLATDVFCILGANAGAVKKSISSYTIETIYNPNFKEGLSASIIIGIQFLIPKNYDSVLIMLADQPKITTNYLNKLLKVAEENPTKIIASNYEKSIGVPAIFPKKYYAKLLELSGDKGAKKLLQKLSLDIVSVKSIDLTDIDTKEDYLKFVKKNNYFYK